MSTTPVGPVHPFAQPAHHRFVPFTGNKPEAFWRFQLAALALVLPPMATTIACTQIFRQLLL
jgi:hypothetical protein